MKHWIFDKQTLQMLTTNLDHNYMTLRAAKDYVWAYSGVTMKARTKEAFIKEFGAKVKENQENEQTTI